jgi:hypothetical protein
MRKLAGLTAVTTLVAALLLAPMAGAKDGRSDRGGKDGVRVAGTCSAASTSKLKLSGEDAGIEVEFEVDQNRNGVRWSVVLVRNGVQVAKRVRVTRAPSGSFEARFVTGNRAGADSFVARAKSPTGEVCTARASIS